MTLRALILSWLGVLLTLLTACGEARDDLVLLRGALNPDAPRYHPRANALASVRPIPPRLEVGFPSRGLSGVMLLESRRDGVETWLTADGATITLARGMLTSAKGFGTGLAASDVAQSTALIQSGTAGVAERFHSFLNGNDEIELHAYKCRITPAGTEAIFVQGLAVSVRRIGESCQGVSQSFNNTYWLDPDTGRVMQSSQWSGDFLGNLTMKVVPQ